MPRFPTPKGGKPGFIGVGARGAVTAAGGAVLDHLADERAEAGDRGNDEPEVEFDDCP